MGGSAGRATTAKAKGQRSGAPSAKLNVKIKPRAEQPERFRTCEAMWAKYPHGVGLPGAKDEKIAPGTGGKVVTNFRRSVVIYTANKRLDLDRRLPNNPHFD